MSRQLQKLIFIFNKDVADNLDCTNLNDILENTFVIIYCSYIFIIHHTDYLSCVDWNLNCADLNAQTLIFILTKILQITLIVQI